MCRPPRYRARQLKKIAMTGLYTTYYYDNKMKFHTNIYFSTTFHQLNNHHGEKHIRFTYSQFCPLYEGIGTGWTLSVMSPLAQQLKYGTCGVAENIQKNSRNNRNKEGIGWEGQSFKVFRNRNKSLSDSKLYHVVLSRNKLAKWKAR